MLKEDEKGPRRREVWAIVWKIKSVCQENGKAFNETDGEFKEEMVRDKTRDICKTQIMKSYK